MQRLSAVAVLLLLTAATVWADGKMFIRGEAKVRIPDQSALICFDGKTERLVIETAFEGKSDEYAWVVPLPAEPKIEAATKGLFPTLRYLARPRLVEYNPSESASLVLLAIGVVLLWAGFYALRSWGEFALFGLLLFLVVGFMVPATARHRGPSTVTVHDSVTILQRGRVGAYDTAVLSGKAGRTVQAWLEENGFRTPATAIPVLDDYVKRGWVFAAARLNKGGETDGALRTHPLSFTFPAAEAVYPLKLTAVDNGPLALDLYVLSRSEAQASGVERLRSAEWVLAPEEDHERRDDARISVAHKTLTEYSSHGGTKLDTFTWLSGTLLPERMAEDLTLTWRPLKAFRPVYHMREGALQIAGGWAVKTLFLGLCVSCFVRWLRNRKDTEGGPKGLAREQARFAITVFLCASVACMFLVYQVAMHMGKSITISVAVLAGIVTVVSFRIVWRWFRQASATTGREAAGRRTDWAFVVWFMISLVVLVVVYLALPVLPDSSVRTWEGWPGMARLVGEKTEAAAEPPSSLDDCRAQVRSVMTVAREVDMELVNSYTAQPLREEDSPGNYTVEQGGEGFVYCIYSDTGRKSVVFRWPVKDADAPPQAPATTSGISEER